MEQPILEAISDKKKRIVKLMSEGKSVKQIGVDVFLSPRTVEAHIKLLKRLLSANNAPHLVAICRREKIID